MFASDDTRDAPQLPVNMPARDGDDALHSADMLVYESDARPQKQVVASQYLFPFDALRVERAEEEAARMVPVARRGRFVTAPW
jgi:hypothetical protein